MRLSVVPFLISLAAPGLAQGEEEHLPFLEAEEAFARATTEGKRVLVYQDWPG